MGCIFWAPQEGGLFTILKGAHWRLLPSEKNALNYDKKKVTQFDNCTTIFRIFWIIVCGAALGGFLFFVIKQLQTLMDMKLGVNVEVLYQSEVDFPAVTICNQNFFKCVKVTGYLRVIDNILILIITG